MRRTRLGVSRTPNYVITREHDPDDQRENPSCTAVEDSHWKLMMRKGPSLKYLNPSTLWKVNNIAQDFFNPGGFHLEL